MVSTARNCDGGIEPSQRVKLYSIHERTLKKIKSYDVRFKSCDVRFNDYDVSSKACDVSFKVCNFRFKAYDGLIGVQDFFMS